MKHQILIIATIISFILLACLLLINKDNIPNSSATDANTVITSTDDWDDGEKNNIDTSNGSLKISDLVSSKVDLDALYTSSPSNFSLSSDCTTSGSISNLIDSALDVAWNILDTDCTIDKYSSFTIDFGSPKTIYKARLYGKERIRSQGGFQIQGSNNGVDFVNVGGIVILHPGLTEPEWFQDDSITATNRYFRFLTNGGEDPPDYYIYEFELYQNSTATHISDIDGGANFWSWDANTITQTVPANTTTKYEYRTSPDGTNWTAWVPDNIAGVTSRTGDDSNNPTRYRYLQIKATLTNTDGASTPTIDSYTIDYHTEVKPGVPTAQTAVVQ